MNHLTNLYKHQCEQLEEQIYNMKKMLYEAEPPPFYVNGDIPAGYPGTTIYGPPSPNPFGLEWIEPNPPRPIAPPAPPGPKFPKPRYPDPRNHDPNGSPAPAPRGTNPPECPYPIGSEEWHEWVKKAGNWHFNNPYTYSSPAWFRCEAAHNEQAIND